MTGLDELKKALKENELVFGTDKTLKNLKKLSIRWAQSLWQTLLILQA